MNTEFSAMCRSFEELSECEKINKMEHILEEVGIQFDSRDKYKRMTGFYISEKYVFVVSELPKKEGYSFTIIDRSKYDEFLADGKGTICFVRRRRGDYKVRIHTARADGRRICMELHRLVMEKGGCDLDVDHKFSNALINTLESLRFATGSQNRKHVKFRNHKLRDLLEDYVCRDSCEEQCAEQVDKEREDGGEFAYNPLRDFSVTWYAYVMHVMLGWGTDKDLEDYNREYIQKYDKAAAAYYKKLLVV